MPAVTAAPSSRRWVRSSDFVRSLYERSAASRRNRQLEALTEAPLRGGSSSRASVQIDADLVGLLRAAALDALDDLSPGLDNHTLGLDDGAAWHREAYGAAYLLGVLGDVDEHEDVVLNVDSLAVGARDALPTVFGSAMSGALERATIAKQDGDEDAVAIAAEDAQRLVLLKADLTRRIGVEQ